MAELKRVKDPKFRVIPNLSLRGKDIMIRLRNGSLKLSQSGQYVIDEKIDDLRRMNKVDAAREHLKTSQVIAETKGRLDQRVKDKIHGPAK